jgi:hypothetical protein
MDTSDLSLLNDSVSHYLEFKSEIRIGSPSTPKVGIVKIDRSLYLYMHVLLLATASIVSPRHVLYMQPATFALTLQLWI